ncbi:putative conjugal transfer protein [compost metagenome]
MARTIAINNFGGGNIIGFIDTLTKQISKNKRVLIVEFPCVGIPKISYLFSQTKIEKEKTIDQLILDYDRSSNSSEKKPIDDYLVKLEHTDLLITNPRSMPELPTIRKCESNKTLIDLPIYIKLQAQESYDYIFYVLQGSLVHPMTHFAIRCADLTILHSHDPYEFIVNYTTYKKLNDYFAIEKERMLLFCDDSNFEFHEEQLANKTSEVLKHIQQVEQRSIEFSSHNKQVKYNTDSVGVIDPLEFLDYQFERLEINTEISQSDVEKLDKLCNQIRHTLKENYLDDYVKSMINDDSRQRIRYFIADEVREQTNFSFQMNIQDVIDYVQREITELGILQEILNNPNISSIEINGPNQVIVEENGVTKHKEEIRFQNRTHYNNTIDKILMPIGKPISSSNPIVDANYRGFRINVIADNKSFSGISAGYSLVSIRKFPPDVYSDEECIKYGNMSVEMINLLKFIISCGASITVSGGTNSGKTTSLIRFPLYMDRFTRILSIEDSEEMMLASKKQYKDYPNLPSLLVKDIEDKDKSFGIDKLVKASLRQNPDVIVIGEIRDEAAAKQALIGMNTGHIVWNTIHSNSAPEAATRFLQLNGNTLAAANQVGVSLDFIIFQKKLKSGVRVITEISELLGYQGVEKPLLNPIFKYNYKTKTHERVGSIKSESMLEKIYLQEPDPSLIDHWCTSIS